MLRSLFAGISGLRTNQTMLDVVGNNIANANTTGFKGSNVIFQDTLSQMLTAGSAATMGPGADGTPGNADDVATRGGTNPIQVGLGVSVGGTTTNFGQGSAQVTGRATDLMIQGDGFFVVQRNGENLFTRAGAFNFDSQGNLVTLDGDLVQGWLADATGAIDYDPANAGNGAAATPTGVTNMKIDFSAIDSYSIGPDGTITGVSGGTKSVLGQIALANFTNPEGLERAGDTAFRESIASGTVAYGQPSAGGMGALMGGALEMSNVDLAQEFTNLIIAQRGFQATSRVITTSDSVLEELVNIKR
ncbi:MAG: flagellar hook-basal body complex protein [Actinomycetota bacterium]